MEILQEKKLSLLRKYYLEASVICLGFALVITIRFVISLNNTFVKYIIEDKTAAVIQVEKTTEALNNNTEALKDIVDFRKSVFKELEKTAK